MMDFRLIECIHIENPCYKKFHGVSIQPTGITVHSTDKAGKVIRRFSQPAAGQSSGMRDNGAEISRTQMLALLGKNRNENDWNRATVKDSSGQTVPVEKAVHAFIGQLADGSYAVNQVLDFTQPVWAASHGPNGSYDGRIWTESGQIAGGLLHVQFEMIEDSAGDPVHCHNLYRTAVQFCAWLCRKYPTIRLENIVSHREAHLRGMASGHGDPENYWARCGAEYTMDGFRADVAALLAQEQTEDPIGPAPEPEPTPDPLLPFCDVSPDDWYADALRWAVEKGVVQPTSGPFKPESSFTKAAAVVWMRRLYKALLEELRG